MQGKAYNQLSGGWINCSHATAMACTISGEILPNVQLIYADSIFTCAKASRKCH
jgi:hypothetical protein